MAHSDEERANSAFWGQLYEHIYGTPPPLNKRAEDSVITFIEEKLAQDAHVTPKKFAEEYHIPLHVFRRWITKLPRVKEIWDELEQSRIQSAKERVIAVASGDADVMEQASVGMNMNVIGAALRMYDQTAKSRSELSGDGGKPFQIVIRNADKPE